jgi:hypothetical protein
MVEQLLPNTNEMLQYTTVSCSVFGGAEFDQTKRGHDISALCQTAQKSSEFCLSITKLDAWP